MRRLLLALALLAVHAGLQAAPQQSHEEMRTAAADFLARQTSDGAMTPRIDVSPPDPRLRVAACDRALETFLPPGARAAGNLVVGVRCRGASPWTIYLSASVRTYQQVVVMARPVPRGALLQPGDLRLEARDTTSLHGGYLEDPSQATGMLTRRPLSPGSVLAHNALEAPDVVQRGQQVVLLARAGGLEVRSAGEALSDGAQGDLIKVRNTVSSRVVEALVTGPGTAVVRF